MTNDFGLQTTYKFTIILSKQDKTEQNRTERNLYILYQDCYLISLSFKIFTSPLLALLLCIQTIEIKGKS